MYDAGLSGRIKHKRGSTTCFVWQVSGTRREIMHTIRCVDHPIRAEGDIDAILFAGGIQRALSPPDAIFSPPVGLTFGAAEATMQRLPQPQAPRPECFPLYKIAQKIRLNSTLQHPTAVRTASF